MGTGYAGAKPAPARRLINNRMKKLLIYIVLVFAYGCQGFLYPQNIYDRYYLMEEELPGLSVVYKLADNDGYIGIVSGGVFAIWNNTHFIVIKKHPLSLANTINEKVIQYYIIHIDKRKSEYTVQRNLMGPFNEVEFIRQREKLKIPLDLEFHFIRD
jgi:hypothetical protein